METVAENKAGFQKTKIGWIPDNWSLKRLNDVADVKRGAGSQYLKYVKENSANNIRLIRIGDFLGTAEVKYIEYTENIKRFRISEGDLLIAGTGATAGITFLVSKEYHDLAFSYNAPRIRTKESIDNHFLYQMLKSELILRQQHALFTGNAQPFLDTKAISNFKLPIPPIEEQKKISEILSTWDAAITDTQNLIQQLKLRKKGLMQQLLSGKKRLSGFDGEWEEVSLGDITNRVTDKNDELNDNVVTISAQRGFVRQEEFFNKRVASKTLSGYYLLKKGQFAYNKSYSNGYPMGAFKRLDDFDKAVVTTLYVCFEAVENKVNSDFLLNYFEAGLMNKGLTRIAQEGGRAHGLLNIGLSDFFGLTLSVPTLEEQTAIASVLNNAEIEIKAQEQKLKELNAQKKGLMQQLLTGQKRVSLK
ncbi:restriction endonuclease subunit S [Flagellimonas sp.]|uniref:restriction endonuclease subunit S n=1 Tax=Flagellimonas sp. TaxID=2058762 RepID=UPI003BAD7422